MTWGLWFEFHDSYRRSLEKPPQKQLAVELFAIRLSQFLHSFNKGLRICVFLWPKGS